MDSPAPLCYNRACLLPANGGGMGCGTDWPPDSFFAVAMSANNDGDCDPGIRVDSGSCYLSPAVRYNSLSGTVSLMPRAMDVFSLGSTAGTYLRSSGDGSGTEWVSTSELFSDVPPQGGLSMGSYTNR